jgi:hypothetical protein
MRVMITTPEAFFGYQLGSDKKIARWNKIVEYFYKIEKESPLIKVLDMGPSTEGNPFLLVLITSKNNMKNLESIQEINKKITNPRDLTEENIKALFSEGKAIVVQSMSLHATEIGGTQMVPELAYDLLTREDDETKNILDNVVSIFVPCFNPDGQIMVTDWYNQWLNTEFEGVGTPFLYHKYSGHDNNRDAFMTNLVESRYMAKILFHDWLPQAYQDHHHMGSYGARLYVAPYSDPIHPHGDPLVWRELSWYGSHMAYKLEEAGKTGIINAAIFSGWAHLGFHWIGIYHNIPSMLTESASAKLATPLFIHPEQLKDGSQTTRVGTRMFPNYNPSTVFPHPWEGGWWRLRDIIEQQKISAWALLDHMARNKDTILWNTYQKAVRQTNRGQNGTPNAYIIPVAQHDQLSAELLVEKLKTQGLEIHRAKEPFTADNRNYDAGSYFISCAQPKTGLIKTLLGRTLFPDDPWTRKEDGTPYRPYDTATDTMAEFMGVSVEPVDDFSELEIEEVTKYKKPVGYVDASSKTGYLFDCRVNASFKALNLLLQAGVEVKRIKEPLIAGDTELPPGNFVALPGHEETLNMVALETGVEFYALEVLEAEMAPIKQQRIGVYQRYWGGNMDEGWTRLCLETFCFPYETLMDEDIKRGNLHLKHDVIIIPNDPPAFIKGGNELKKWWKENRPTTAFPHYPPEYRSGLGEEGAEILKDFVNKGGVLICLGEACEYAIETLDLKVANALKDLNSKEFHCPGSTLKTSIDIYHSIGYGMPDQALSLFWNSPAFRIIPNPDNHKYEIVAVYPEKDILQSGYLKGEEKLANKIAIINILIGDGKAVLIGPRVQHRCQTHGTFKLLFNSLIS